MIYAFKPEILLNTKNIASSLNICSRERREYVAAVKLAWFSTSNLFVIVSSHETKQTVITQACSTMALDYMINVLTGLTVCQTVPCIGHQNLAVDFGP